jgi:hypothetical protein
VRTAVIIRPNTIAATKKTKQWRSVHAYDMSNKRQDVSRTRFDGDCGGPKVSSRASKEGCSHHNSFRHRFTSPVVPVTRSLITCEA